MASELAALGALVLIQLALGIMATAMIGKVTGTDWLFSSREEAADYRKGLAGRLDRARSNGFEALILFTPAVALVVLADRSTMLTAYAAWTFIIARVVYIGCYAADLVPWRTFVWFVGWFAILAMVLGAYMQK